MFVCFLPYLLLGSSQVAITGNPELVKAYGRNTCQAAMPRLPRQFTVEMPSF